MDKGARLTPWSGEHLGPSTPIANHSSWHPWAERWFQRTQVAFEAPKEDMMSTYLRITPPAEKPSAVQLAILEWQRQLVERKNETR
jgi:hypothetical protein